MIPGTYLPAPAAPAAVPVAPAAPVASTPGAPAAPMAGSGQWMNWLQQALGGQGQGGQLPDGWLRLLRQRRKAQFGVNPPGGPRAGRSSISFGAAPPAAPGLVANPQPFAASSGLDWLGARLRDARSTIDA